MKKQIVLSTEPIAFSVNFVTCLTTFLAAFIGFFILIRFIRELKQRNNRVMLAYFFNTYLMISLYATTLFTNSINTFLSDISIHLDNSEFASPRCLMRAHLGVCFLVGLYLSFCAQASFRYIRIGYPRLTGLLTLKPFLILLSLQWIVSLLFPIFYTKRSKFHIDDHNCYCSLDDFPVLIYFITIVYCLPMGIILLIYSRILIHTKRTPRVLNILTSRRDIIVVRRIVLLIMGLMGLATPLTTLWIFYMVTGKIHPMSYRLGYMINGITEFLLSIMTIFVTPPLPKIQHKIFGALFGGLRQNHNRPATDT